MMAAQPTGPSAGASWRLATWTLALLLTGASVSVAIVWLMEPSAPPAPKPAASLDELIGASTGLVAVDFSAEWCGPCRRLEPVLEELETEYAGRVEIVRIDVDEHQALASQYGIHGIPCVVLFKDRIEVDRKVGLHPKEDYQAWFDASL